MYTDEDRQKDDSELEVAFLEETREWVNDMYTIVPGYMPFREMDDLTAPLKIGMIYSSRIAAGDSKTFHIGEGVKLETEVMLLSGESYIIFCSRADKITVTCVRRSIGHVIRSRATIAYLRVVCIRSFSRRYGICPLPIRRNRKITVITRVQRYVQVKFIDVGSTPTSQDFTSCNYLPCGAEDKYETVNTMKYPALDIEASRSQVLHLEGLVQYITFVPNVKSTIWKGHLNEKRKPMTEYKIGYTIDRHCMSTTFMDLSQMEGSDRDSLIQMKFLEEGTQWANDMNVVNDFEWTYREHNDLKSPLQEGLYSCFLRNGDERELYIKTKDYLKVVWTANVEIGRSYVLFCKERESITLKCVESTSITIDGCNVAFIRVICVSNMYIKNGIFPIPVRKNTVCTLIQKSSRLTFIRFLDPEHQAIQEDFQECDYERCRTTTDEECLNYTQFEGISLETGTARKSRAVYITFAPISTTTLHMGHTKTIPETQRKPLTRPYTIGTVPSYSHARKEYAQQALSATQTKATGVLKSLVENLGIDPTSEKLTEDNEDIPVDLAPPTRIRTPSGRELSGYEASVYTFQDKSQSLEEYIAKTFRVIVAPIQIVDSSETENANMNELPTAEVVE